MSEPIARENTPGTFQIEMFGGLCVRRGDQCLAQYTPQQTGVLLALLALNMHRACTREYLIETIWPDVEAESGRASLRQGLYKLRHQLEPTTKVEGDLFLRTQTDIYLNPAVVRTDVQAFDHALQEASRAGEWTDRARLLSEAVALYRDHLLPGFYQEVFALERRRLQRAFQTALHELAVATERLGSREEVLACARQAAVRFPRWAAIRIDLMRLFLASGQPAEALQEYEALHDLWQHESGDAPDAETRALAAHFESAARVALRSSLPAESARQSPKSVPPPQAHGVTLGAVPGPNKLPFPEQSSPLPDIQGRAHVRARIWTVILLLSVMISLLWRNRLSTHVSYARPRHLVSIDMRFHMQDMALDPRHHRLYLSNTGGDVSGVGVLDTLTNRVLEPIPLGSQLFGIAIDTNKNEVYVAGRHTEKIVVWDGATRKMLRSFAADGTDTAEITYDPESQRLFVLNAQPPGLTVLDSAGVFRGSVALRDRQPVRIVSDPPFHRLFVVCQESHCVQVIDTDTLRPALLFPTDVNPVDLVVDAKRNRIFVTNFTSGTLDVFDGTTYTRLSTLTLNCGPRGLALDQVTDHLYICGSSDNTLVVVNADTLQVEDGFFTSGYHPISCLIDADARRLFVTYDAQDVRVYALL